MPLRLTSLRRNRWLASLLVAAFVLRALIPSGFMPGGNGAFRLQICPEGFPVALLPAGSDHSAHAAHHHHHVAADAHGLGDGDPLSESPQHDHKSWMSAHCVFGAAASGPPSWHPPVISAASETRAPGAHRPSAPVTLDRRFRIAQPRGPPLLV